MKIPGKRASTVFLLCFVQQQQCLHTGPEVAKHQGEMKLSETRFYRLTYQLKICSEYIMHNLSSNHVSKLVRETELGSY